MPARKKLVFVLPSASGGGAERVFINLLQMIDRSIYELHLVLVNPVGAYLPLIPEDIFIWKLGHRRVGKSIFKLLKVFRQVQPDIILSTMVHLNLAVLLLKTFFHKKAKFVIRESNTLSRSLSTGFKSLIYRQLARRLYPFADAIICPGNGVKKDLISNFNIKNKIIYSLPNPVCVDNIRLKMIQEDNPFVNGNPQLIAAGNLSVQKGFDLLVESMKILVKKRPDIHLTILGEGPEEKNLKNQIKSSGLTNWITLRGFQNNPYPYFFYSDIFVLTSRWEGLPNVVLESLACGTPVVAFNCPGSVDEIIDYPSQGILIPPYDIKNLADAVHRLLQSRPKESKKSLLSIKYEACNATARYENVLSEL